MKNAVATKEDTKKNGEMLLRREHPFFDTLQNEMNRLFEDFGHGLGFPRTGKWLESLGEFHAKVDVKETDKEVVVSAEVPGVDIKDIDVSLKNGGLLIKGEKRQEKEEKDKGYYRMERSYGSFERYLPLPCEIDRESVAASYKDGVVKITMQKTKEAIKNEKPIEVTAG